MNLGATCCTTKKPDCLHCPLQSDCLAFKNNCQLLYPARKTKKPVPLQQQQFLVLYNNQGHIYLEKRPPVGLWGGLWCLPSIDKDCCPIDFIRAKYDLAGEVPEFITGFKHCFSHFHLEINAFSIKTRALGNKLAETKGQWFAKDKFSSVGLARPTSKILSLVE